MPENYGSNLSQFGMMPDWLLEQYFGKGQGGPSTLQPVGNWAASPTLNLGPSGPVNQPVTPPQWGSGTTSTNWGGYTPPMDIPLELPPPLPDLPAGGTVDPFTVGNPPSRIGPGTSPGAPRTAGTTTPGTPSTTGFGTRGDDSGRVPGVDLSLNDRINMVLRNFNLPPLPTGFNMFGGLPAGFTEGNRFGGGAPTFTGPGFTGPGWQPGGSMFGQLPGVRGGPLAGSFAGLGSFGGGTMGNLGGVYANTIARHMLQSGRIQAIAEPGAGPPMNWGGRHITYSNVGDPISAANMVALRNYLSGGGRTGFADAGAHGIGGGGRAQTKSFQEGGVVEDPDTGIQVLPEQPRLGLEEIMQYLAARRDRAYRRTRQSRIYENYYNAEPRPMYYGRGFPLLGSTDTIRAGLTPGEMVLTEPQQSAVQPIPGREHLLRPDQLRAFGLI